MALDTGHSQQPLTAFATLTRRRARLVTRYRLPV
jgi:hypothetical protein